MFSIFAEGPYRNILYAVGILIVGFVIVKFLTDILKQFAKKKELNKLLTQLSLDKNTLDFLISGIKYFLYIIVVVLAIGQFGVTIMFL